MLSFDPPPGPGPDAVSRLGRSTRCFFSLWGWFVRARAFDGSAWHFLILTIGKVFLYDLGELEDLYRVASLAGLAMSLIFVSLAYQRFVFRKDPEGYLESTETVAIVGASPAIRSAPAITTTALAINQG